MGSRRHKGEPEEDVVVKKTEDEILTEKVTKILREVYPDPHKPLNMHRICDWEKEVKGCVGPMVAEELRVERERRREDLAHTLGNAEKEIHGRVCGLTEEFKEKLQAIEKEIPLLRANGEVQLKRINNLLESNEKIHAKTEDRIKDLEGNLELDATRINDLHDDCNRLSGARVALLGALRELDAKLDKETERGDNRLNSSLEKIEERLQKQEKSVDEVIVPLLAKRELLLGQKISERFELLIKDAKQEIAQEQKVIVAKLKDAVDNDLGAWQSGSNEWTTNFGEEQARLRDEQKRLTDEQVVTQQDIETAFSHMKDELETQRADIGSNKDKMADFILRTSENIGVLRALRLAMGGGAIIAMMLSAESIMKSLGLL
jgi:hypothetical protein